MELNEEEKRQLFQVDGDCQTKVLDELYMTARFTRNPEQRDMVRGLMAKLRVLSDEQCMDLVKDIQKNYHLPYSDFPFRFPMYTRARQFPLDSLLTFMR